MKAHLIAWHTLLDLAWLLLLVLVFGYFWRGRQVTLQTQSWVKTRGRITQCEWVTCGHSLWPKVEYIFQVGDRDYTGEYLFLDTAHNDPHSRYARNVAYKAAKAFKDNEDVTVYYDPDNPEHAVLDVKIPRKLNLILVMIAALIVLHIIIVLLRLF